MKCELEGCVSDFYSDRWSYDVSPTTALLTLYDYGGMGYVKFAVSVDDIVKWNDKKIRVIIETVEEE